VIGGGVPGSGGSLIGAGSSGGSRSSTYDVDITSGGVSVQIVTMKCAGECADVEAVATGGHEPYTYLWEDGSTAATRHLCPGASTSFSVTATDTGDSSQEFERKPQVATATVTAQVLGCTSSDAGVPPPPPPPPPTGELCLQNGSFEGTPHFNVQGTFSANPDPAKEFDAVPWKSCNAFEGADVWNKTLAGHPDSTLTPPDPTQGATYARMYASELLNHIEPVSQKNCGLLLAGGTYRLKLDAVSEKFGAENVKANLEIWGGSSECGEQELLWKSEPLDFEWKTLCVTLSPKNNLNYLTFKPRAPALQRASVFLDNVVSAQTCN